MAFGDRPALRLLLDVNEHDSPPVGTEAVEADVAWLGDDDLPSVSVERESRLDDETSLGVGRDSEAVDDTPAVEASVVKQPLLAQIRLLALELGHAEQLAEEVVVSLRLGQASPLMRIMTIEQRARQHPDVGQTVAVTIGLLHPGEMGAALGVALRDAGQTVLWASHGRSAATVARADAAGLEDVGTVDEVSRRSDVIVSVCPPHAAVTVARELPRFAGVYVDANAVSPATARTIARLVDRFADGGIVGPPPREPGTTRLYLSGAEAPLIAELFAPTAIDARIVSQDPGAASAVKMTFAAWTKGTSALLLAIRALARAEDVEDALLEEWRLSLPDLPERSAAAARSALAKGWRWVGEMDEIADTFAEAGLPDGFHRAAAAVFRQSPHEQPDDQASLERVMSAMLDGKV